MDAAVVVESGWGNTRAIAHAVAEGLRKRVSVEVFDVDTAPPADQLDVELLVVGGPTHALGMSRPETRADAASRGAQVVTKGIREWLEEPAELHVRAATFDTHVRRPNLPGTASRKAARVLRSLGAQLVAEPEIFWVRRTEGPLLPGELERARAWGAELAGLLPQPAY